MSMTEEKRQYLFLSEQTLLYNVAVRSRRGGKESLYTLAEAGENWYEVHKEQEMILLGDSVLDVKDFCNTLEREGADLCVICNPNNPTSTATAPSEMWKILSAAGNLVSSS